MPTFLLLINILAAVEPFTNVASLQSAALQMYKKNFNYTPSFIVQLYVVVKVVYAAALAAVCVALTDITIPIGIVACAAQPLRQLSQFELDKLPLDDQFVKFVMLLITQAPASTSILLSRNIPLTFTAPLCFMSIVSKLYIVPLKYLKVSKNVVTSDKSELLKSNINDV